MASYRTAQYQGVDTAGRITAKIATNLKSNGISFVGRYLGGSYALTRQEVDAIHGSGLAVFVFFERNAGDLKQGASKGVPQGRSAYQEARALNLPRNTCIYFACDEAATTVSQFNAIAEYLVAAKAELQGYYRCGIYGSYFVVEQMYNRKVCDNYCQCVAWSQEYDSIKKKNVLKVSPNLDIFQYDWQYSSSVTSLCRAVGVPLQYFDLCYCPNLRSAGMWIPDNFQEGRNASFEYADEVAGSSSYSYDTHDPSSVFVPRTVAPLADEQWWMSSKNPCISRMNGTVLPNCFVGSTQIITDQGVMTLRKAYDYCRYFKTFDVPTLDNEWHPASVEYFGKQKIYQVKLESSTYYCTGNHRWYIWTKRGYKTVTTVELKPSMKIPYRMCNTEPYTHATSVKDTGRYEGVYCVVEPETKSFTLAGGELTGNCVGYAYGRFSEILGYFHPDLPICDAGNWIDEVKKKGTLKYGDTPKLGAVAVWKNPGKSGHVAVVEYINNDGTIMLSESGYNANWNTRFWNLGPQSKPNWYSSPYQFQGFIYNPATESIHSVVPYTEGVRYGTIIPEDSPRYDRSNITNSIDYVSGTSSYAEEPDHPARLFVRQAILHCGSDGHNWVKSITGIQENRDWCVATCCAAAVESSTDLIIPKDEFVASSFAKKLVEELGGKYFIGRARGGTDNPQTGDIFAISKYNDLLTSSISKYSASRLGIVRELDGDTVLTVEGDISNKILLNRRRLSDISWYVRPNWTKLGGSEQCTTLMKNPLYNTASIRADATLREVSYLTDHCEPSINLESVKLSAINYTGVLSGVYDILKNNNQLITSGYTQNNYSIDSSMLQPPVVKEIFDYIVNKGLLASQAIGFLANIQRVSKFSTAKLSLIFEAVGICGWTGSRKLDMIDKCGSFNWSNNLSGQLDFMWAELENPENNTLSVLKSIVSSEDEVSAKKSAEIVLDEYFKNLVISHDSEVKIVQSLASTLWKEVRVVQKTSSYNNSYSASTIIRTQSGKQLQIGESKEIPSWVIQSGISANSTYYPDFFSRWARSLAQGKLADIWNEQDRPSQFFIATIDGYFLVATTTLFGSPGDIISVVLEDGTFFNCIIADSKGENPLYSPHANETGNIYGHAFGNGSIDIIEFESMGSTSMKNVSELLVNGLTQAGWYKKKITKIVNYGSWLDR